MIFFVSFSWEKKEGPGISAADVETSRGKKKEKKEKKSALLPSFGKKGNRLLS